MDVIRHNNKGVEIIAMESAIAILNCIDHYSGNFRNLQEARAPIGTISRLSIATKALPEVIRSFGNALPGGKLP